MGAASAKAALAAIMALAGVDRCLQSAPTQATLSILQGLAVHALLTAMALFTRRSRLGVVAGGAASAVALVRSTVCFARTFARLASP